MSADGVLEQLPAARQHVQRLHALSPKTDPEAWALSIAAHLAPLPPDRAWRRLRTRHGVSVVADLVPPVVQVLAPTEGTRPQARCPRACAALHAADDAQEVA